MIRFMFILSNEKIPSKIIWFGWWFLLTCLYSESFTCCIHSVLAYSRGINQSTILLVISNIQQQRCLELFYRRIILCQQACDSYVQQIASEYLNHDRMYLYMGYNNINSMLQSLGSKYKYLVRCLTSLLVNEFRNIATKETIISIK